MIFQLDCMVSFLQDLSTKTEIEYFDPAASTWQTDRATGELLEQEKVDVKEAKKEEVLGQDENDKEEIQKKDVAEEENLVKRQIGKVRKRPNVRTS